MATSQLPYSPYPVPTPWVNQPGASGYQASQAMQQQNRTYGPQIPQGFVANPYSGPTYASPADVNAVTQQSQVPFTPRLSTPTQQNASQSGGSILGANTSNTVTRSEALNRGWDVNNLPGGYSLDDSEARAAASAREAQVRGTINDGFGSILGRLDQMAGLLPQQEQQDISTLESQYNTQRAARQSDYQSSVDKLGTYRKDVETRKKATMDELANNMRNMLKAGNTMLGAYGAGDSSAVGMYNYALAKQADQRAGAVQKQANDQYSELDRKALDVKSAFDQSIGDLDTWKATSIDQIRQSTRARLDQINQAKIGADQSRLQALSSLETGLLNQAVQSLAQIDSEHRNYARQIQQWQMDRIAQLQNYKMQLGQAGNFSPAQMTYDAMQGLNAGQFQNTDQMYNPYVLMQKKKAEF